MFRRLASASAGGLSTAIVEHDPCTRSYTFGIPERATATFTGGGEPLEVVMSEQIKRGSERVRRHLNKEKAARHLIHCAIRMIVSAEDPHAIHLLVHSADKISCDVAKATGKQILLETILRKEKRKEFFSMYREGSNYLKHANKDFDKDFPLRDIAMMNALALVICIANFQSVFDRATDHMQLFARFMHVLVPDIVDTPADQAAAFRERDKSVEGMTPRSYFEMAWEHQTVLGLNLNGERAEDTKDSTDFYDTTFAEFEKAREIEMQKKADARKDATL